MKKKFKLLQAVMLMTTLFIGYGCSSKNDPIPIPQESQSSLDGNKVMQVLVNFAKNTNAETKSNINTFNIKELTKETLNFNLSSKQSRSADINEVPNKTSIDLYTVIFERNGSKGYSILTADDRLESVYAFTEYGELSDTIENKTLGEIIRLIPEMCKTDIENFYTQPMPRESIWDTRLRKIGPLITSKMDTKWPYNKLFPIVTGTTDRPEFNNHYTSNTTAVAIAQMLCVYGPKGVISISTPTEDELASKFRFVAYDSDPQGRHWAQYMDGVTYHLLSACKYFDKAGFKYEYKKAQKHTDDKKVFNSLFKNGMPVIMENFVEPRTWIISGIECEYYVDSNELDLIRSLHCNWGLNGKSDGWYGNWLRPAHHSYNYTTNDILYFQRAF